jgi:hypothetical protein
MRTIPFDQSVFIGYYDEAMTQEKARAYPYNEKSYYEFMDDMIEHCKYWQCLDKRIVDIQLSPYEQWQVDKYGNITQPASHTPAEESFESGISELERLSAWLDTQAEMHQLGY